MKSHDEWEEERYRAERRHEHVEIQEEIARALTRIKKGVDKVDLEIVKYTNALRDGMREICMGLESIKNAQDRLSQKLLEKRK